MSEIPPAIVGDAYLNERSWEFLEELTDIGNRLAGTDGEKEARELVKKQFSAIDAHNIETNEFEFPGWQRGTTTLEVNGSNRWQLDRQHEIVALPGSPSGDIEAEIYSIDAGVPGDFDSTELEGKIVMTSNRTPAGVNRRLQRYEKYARAANAGAVGFLFRNQIPGCVPAVGTVNPWADTTNDDTLIGSVVGAAISREEGRRILRHLKKGSVTASLEVNCTKAPAKSKNIEAVLGPESKEEVLLTAHIDAHDLGNGARDNGFGSALVVEVGRLLSQIESELDSRVRLVLFGAEEFGLYGSDYWIKNNNSENIKCVINLDGIGFSNNLYVRTHGFDEIGRAFKEVEDEVHTPVKVTDELNMYGDHWTFASNGVPSAYVGSEQRDSTSGVTPKGWGHTHADTLDKHNYRDFRELAIALTTGIIKLTENERKIAAASTEEVRSALIDQGYEDTLKVTDRWRW
ncbi:M28 family metallopeptidase [Halopenitus persicus]|uniref:M28 family metallopeptidase n=1 Tax=Halopenitus persicus TaxID=1048396 RepID=UPI000BBA5C5A|nr:M28 family metallopeptidase [Halopenitus persicus]